MLSTTRRNLFVVHCCLLLDGFDQTAVSDAIDHDRNSFLIFEYWPLHFRNEALRYPPQKPTVVGRRPVAFCDERIPAGTFFRRRAVGDRA
jgi:hypothetical protein